ncbi:MAG: hypothetical protein QOF58_1436 [Pseudonocardiales bacterium]|nr:hypothetical protein [Pseudonocardiales bacterium]
MPATPIAAVSSSEALFTAYRAEQNKLDAMIAASHAKSPATDTRLAELKTLQDTAHQRWTDATAALATAREAGDIDAITTARENADKEYSAYDAVADQCITEGLKITRERSEERGGVLEQMRVMDNAYTAWLASVSPSAP